MPKQRTETAAGATSGGARVMEVGPAVERTSSPSASAHEQIAQLAYSYWQTRGCPDGSPEEDWLRAEADLQTPTTKVAA